MKSLIGKRKAETHKGDYGRVGVIAGSVGFTGAAYLTSFAALRTGSGYVFTYVPESIYQIMSIKLTEAIVLPVDDCGTGAFSGESLNDLLEYISGMDVLAVGPGIGVDANRTYLLKELIRSSKKPIVLDADALNCIAKEVSILGGGDAPLVVTPHPGELARLLGISVSEVQGNRVYYSELLAKKYNIIVILKGSETVVSSYNKETYINKTGNPGMATAGSGDVLTGIVASLIGQGLDVFEASKLGVYLHGKAGDLSSDRLGEHGMLASDIIDDLPIAIKNMEKENK